MLRTSILLAALLVARCGDPLSPPGSPSVTLAVHFSSGNGGGGRFVITARATNRSEAPITYMEGCGEATGIGFEVWGPDGCPVQLVPSGTRPSCADQALQLGPQAGLDAELPFDGTLYDSQGRPRAAPEGRYVVVGTFRWWSVGSEPAVVQQSLSFLWPRER